MHPRHGRLLLFPDSRAQRGAEREAVNLRGWGEGRRPPVRAVARVFRWVYSAGLGGGTARDSGPVWGGALGVVLMVGEGVCCTVSGE